MIIKSAKYVISGTKVEHFPEEKLPEFLLSGRSNVGKSSFINMVLNHNGLARISSKPGKTQTINYYIVNDSFYFVDVPGYGYAKVSQQKRKEFGLMIENYFKKRKTLKLVFLLVDFRHSPTDDDKTMYDFVKYYNIKTVVIATKKDKVKRSMWAKQEKIIKETLNMDSDDLLIPCSIVTKDGLDLVHEIILKELA